MSGNVAEDPLLRDATLVDGFRCLPPCLLYQRIGEGGMGVVFKARHVNLDVDVAVKVLKPALAASDPRYVERFEREARMAARLDHDCLVRVLDVSTRGALCYMVMELVTGETARERVLRKGALAEEEALRIAHAAARGLAAAHAAVPEAIVHRDVKPDNVLVTADGRVKLGDLGLARLASAEGLLTQPGQVWGTPKFMAPEQWDPEGLVDPRTDVWALGATLWFLLAGEEPFESTSYRKPVPDVRERRRDVRPEVAALIARCTATDPAQRFADGGELVSALRRLLDDGRGLSPDPQTGTQTLRVADVSPPPPRASVLHTRKVLAGTDTAPRRRGWALPRAQRAVLSVAALVAVGVAGWVLAPRGEPGGAGGPAGGAPAVETNEAALGGMPAERGEGDGDGDGDGRGEAGELLAQGQQLIRDPARLSEGIAVLERCRSLSPELAGLAAALDAAYRAAVDRDLAEDNLLAAWESAQAWASCHSEAAAPAIQRVRGAIGARLRAGVSVSPVPGSVHGQSIEVAVAVRDSDVAAVRIRGARARITAGVAREVLTFEADGHRQIEVDVEHRTGVVETFVVPIVIDTQPPALEVVEPVAGALVRPPVRVAGRVRDSTAVTLRCGDEELAVRDGEFLARLFSLPDGEQDVLLVARDGANLETRVSRRVVVDGRAPLLTLQELPARTRERTLRVRGRVDEAATVRVQGRPVAVGEGGAFEAVVSLREGRNEIAVAAVDLAGNEAEPATRPVEVEPEAKLPADWDAEILDATPGPKSGYPKKVRDRRSDIVFLLVEPGEFQMGSERGEENEQPVHRVRITKPFYLAETETTQAQWESVMGSNPSCFRGAQRPVDSVIESDVVAFLAALNGGSRDGPFRLPTEAEWEYACRAGTTTAFAFGDTISTDQANHISGAGARGPTDVRTLAPNAWGFYDMHGNVGEQCADYYDARYYEQCGNPAVDPRGPDSGWSRAVRGGSWADRPVHCRSASRAVRSLPHAFVGFRAARTL